MTKFFRSAPVAHQKIQPLTVEEVPLFLNSVLQHFPQYYPLFLCAICKADLPELAGLQWGYIDQRYWLNSHSPQ